VALEADNVGSISGSSSYTDDVKFSKLLPKSFLYVNRGY
jgi:hypothetical protein